MSTFTDAITVEELEFDPYPVYARLRQEEPVAWVPALGSWFVTTWHEVRRSMSDLESFTTVNPATPLARYCGPGNILGREGDAHSQLKESVDDLFAPVHAAQWAALAESAAREQFDSLVELGSADLMATYFKPVCVGVIGRYLGLTPAEASTVTRWSEGLIAALTNAGQDSAAARPGWQALAEIDAALGAQLDRLGRCPDSSVPSRLLQCAGPADTLATLKMIISALLEPAWLCANTMYALLTHPQQLAAVRADPGLTAVAVAEGLRWMGPVGALGRLTTRQVTLGGVVIPAGTPVTPVIAAANRDGSVFEDAERFDVHRRPAPHLSLGYARHQCLAVDLVPTVVAATLRVLLERCAALRMETQNQPYGFKFRKFSEFPVSWS
ncbi:cytochrome P450 [Catenulispora rubra]|uniref:cytochrome P450 n=1 Tax=Catenulispora rubra TaxID=280293 RepID=UPI0018928524|nr:cytochrome P450 [Catenulispora rubra]